MYGIRCVWRLCDFWAWADWHLLCTALQSKVCQCCTVYLWLRPLCCVCMSVCLALPALYTVAALLHCLLPRTCQFPNLSHVSHLHLCCAAAVQQAGVDPLLVQEVFMGNVMSAGLGQVRHLFCKHTDCTISASEHCSSNIHTGDPTVPGLERQLHGLSSAAEGGFTTALHEVGWHVLAAAGFSRCS